MKTISGFFLKRIVGAFFGGVFVMTVLACTDKTQANKSNTIQTVDAVRVSSKVDTEGDLLGNMILLLLEENGIPTINKIQLGTTKIVRYALLNNEIDIYPEYTGSAAFNFNNANNPAWKNAEATYNLGKNLDYEQNKIVWLKSAPANNTWAIAVRSDLAASNNLKTLEDLSKYINDGHFFKMVASSEFMERGDALPLFEKTYAFKLKPNQVLPLPGGDVGVFAKAAAEQKSGVNAALVYGTSGAVAQLGLVVLEDSKMAQPIFEPVPMIRESVLKKYPQIADILNPVFSSLDLKTLQHLNGLVAFEGKDAKLVAADYLKSKGFLKQ
ncbi:glycine betaine ABC transporter substrate-binding protein OsmF [Hydromonas duriensis]|uniref:Osmoprotectant transport system substrate-binding protein n=1 Tax=Hydromonas duriensis TaxID=1527608 RepID=A0A4R6Y576_9BURK|nr:glycine betaine ABC transporter substrate-binding protein [Hydromonas duriensis]TDR30500.1 osmoprotectant transport system substrate-binding protein [Hydromonas duriensis]